MDKKTNIMLAKQYMVESIYRSANIEGIGVTFPETQTICDGMSIAGHTIDDIDAVRDMKNAWKWVFENIDAQINTDTLCTINSLVGKYTVINAGCLRDEYDEPIRVPLYDGENYCPPVPPSKDELDKILASVTSEKNLDQALDLFCEVCKRQVFNNGNKRTATIYANLFMIQNGLGILSIPVNDRLEFYDALTRYYENDENKDILKDFLRNKCITGNKR